MTLSKYIIVKFCVRVCLFVLYITHLNVVGSGLNFLGGSMGTPRWFSTGQLLKYSFWKFVFLPGASFFYFLPRALFENVFCRIFWQIWEQGTATKRGRVGSSDQLGPWVTHLRSWVIKLTTMGTSWSQRHQIESMCDHLIRIIFLSWPLMNNYNPVKV